MRFSRLNIQNFAIFYMSTWTIAPPLAYSMLARILAMVAALVWVVLEALRPDGILRRPTIPVLMAFVFILYTGTIDGLVEGKRGLLRNIQQFIMLLFLVIQQSRRDRLDTLIPVFWWILIQLPVWLFITFKTVAFQDFHAARVGVRVSEEALNLSEAGVGGYPLVYGTVLALPLLLSMGLSRQRFDRCDLPGLLPRSNGWARGVIWLNFGLGVSLVMTAGYSIAVISLALSLLAAVWLRSYRTKRVLWVFILAGLALVFGEAIVVSLLHAVQPYTEGTQFFRKVDDLLVSIEIGSTTGSAEDRRERYARSLEIFIENPFLGDLVYANVGKHSAILDRFAQWGFCLGAVYVYLVAFLPTRALRRLKSVPGMFGPSLGILVTVMIIFGLNDECASAGVMLYLMFPVGMHLLEKQRTALQPLENAGEICHA